MHMLVTCWLLFHAPNLFSFFFFLSRMENSLKEKFEVASQRHPTEIEPVEKQSE